MTETKTVGRKDKDREAAKEAGLPLVQYRVLRALVKAGANGLSYREIEKVTGYYSVLTSVLMEKSVHGVHYPDSLGSKKLVKFAAPDEDDVFRFTATAKGRKVFGK